MVDNENDLNITLTIKFKGVSVDLNVSESLIVINTLAVKRAALRGALWSTAGKKTEKYLMSTLCMLFNVPKENFDQNSVPESMREVDFYLIKGNNYYRSEVKLMGKGNPESADAIFARESNLFVADKLSDLNKIQADKLNVEWVCLRDANGYKRFTKALDKWEIPYERFEGNLDKKLDKIFEEIFE